MIRGGMGAVSMLENICHCLQRTGGSFPAFMLGGLQPPASGDQMPRTHIYINTYIQIKIRGRGGFEKGSHYIYIALAVLEHIMLTRPRTHREPPAFV